MIKAIVFACYVTGVTPPPALTAFADCDSVMLKEEFKTSGDCTKRAKEVIEEIVGELRKDELPAIGNFICLHLSHKPERT
jgi:hypothetical protein